MATKTSDKETTVDDKVRELFNERPTQALVKIEDETKRFTIEGTIYTQKKVLGNTRTSSTVLVEGEEGDLGVVKTLKHRLPHGYDAQELDEALKSFQREGRILGRLRHDQIPSIRSTFYSTNSSGETNFHLFMEHKEGPTLDTLIPHEGFSEEEAVKKMLSILKPIAYSHEQEPVVLHRDIKPSNIIWNEENNEAYLVDFGLALDEAVGSRGRDTMAGTEGYCDPLQFFGFPSEQTDIYSAGVTLAQMVTGHHPKEMMIENPSSPEERFSIDYTSFAEGVDGEIDEIILNCINPNLDERYKSVQELVADLEGYLAQELAHQAVEESLEMSYAREKVTSGKNWTDDLLDFGAHVAAIAGGVTAAVYGVSLFLGAISGSVHFPDTSTQQTVLIGIDDFVEEDDHFLGFLPLPRGHPFTRFVEYSTEGIVETTSRETLVFDYQHVNVRTVVDYEITDVTTAHRLYSKDAKGDSSNRTLRQNLGKRINAKVVERIKAMRPKEGFKHPGAIPQEDYELTLGHLFPGVKIKSILVDYGK